MSATGFLAFASPSMRAVSAIREDAEPEKTGLKILEWIRTADLVYLAYAVDQITVVDWRRQPAPQERRLLRPWANRYVGTLSPEDAWLRLLHGTQGRPAEILEAGYVEDASRRVSDYGYAVDVTRGEFQVYRRTYNPNNCIARWRFDALPGNAGFFQSIYPSDDWS